MLQFSPQERTWDPVLDRNDVCLSDRTMYLAVLLTLYVRGEVQAADGLHDMTCSEVRSSTGISYRTRLTLPDQEPPNRRLCNRNPSSASAVPQTSGLQSRDNDRTEPCGGAAVVRLLGLVQWEGLYKALDAVGLRER